MSIQELTEPTTTKIPAFLIKETIDGRNFYYPNFRKVMAGEKTLDDIVGCSTLQSFIVDFLYRFIVKNYSTLLFLGFDNETVAFLSTETGT